MNRIVKIGVLTLVAASILLSFVAASAGDEELKPAIFIPKLIHDYGRVFERETYEYTFTVQNRGKADLVIESVKPG